MSVIRTFVSHHGGDYEERVAPILRQMAPLGVRPWIDKVDLGDRVGLSLAGQIEEAIFRGPCSSMSLFLSKHSVTRKWVEREVELALQRLDGGFRVLPIFLDPPDEIDLPPTFRRLLIEQKPLWLEPFKDPRFVEKYARSVWASGGLTVDSEEVTLYLGHRNPSWTVEVPAQYSHAPTLDLRLNLIGDRQYSPADTEWKTIEDGLDKIDKYLTCLKRINVCGFAPLGVGTLIGKIWDRVTGVQIFSDNFYQRSHQTWTTDGKDFQLADNWSPDVANESQVKMSRPTTARYKAMLMAFLPAGRDIEYMPHIERWLKERDADTLIQKVILPAHVASPEQAQQLVRECVGAVRFVKRECPEIKLIEIISAYPLALAPLIACHLKKCGPLHFYDEVQINHEYRLAALIP